jgi:hypothetical protein
LGNELNLSRVHYLSPNSVGSQRYGRPGLAAWTDEIKEAYILLKKSLKPVSKTPVYGAIKKW